MRGGGGAGGVEEQAAATRTSPVTARRRTRVRPNSRSIARELIVAAGSVASCCLPYFGKDVFGQSVHRLDDEALRHAGPLDAHHQMVYARAPREPHHPVGDFVGGADTEPVAGEILEAAAEIGALARQSGGTGKRAEVRRDRGGGR